MHQKRLLYDKKSTENWWKHLVENINGRGFEQNWNRNLFVTVMPKTPFFIVYLNIQIKTIISSTATSSVNKHSITVQSSAVVVALLHGSVLFQAVQRHDLLLHVLAERDRLLDFPRIGFGALPLERSVALLPELVRPTRVLAAQVLELQGRRCKFGNSWESCNVQTLLYRSSTR